MRNLEARNGFLERYGKTLHSSKGFNSYELNIENEGLTRPPNDRLWALSTLGVNYVVVSKEQRLKMEYCKYCI